MGRHDLNGTDWAVIQPLLPNKPGGVPRVDDRRVIDGILWRFRTGCSWRDAPTCYGPRTTLFNRFTRWRAAGVWQRIFGALSEHYDDRIVMIDSSVVRFISMVRRLKKGRCGALSRRTRHQDPRLGRPFGTAGAPRSNAGTAGRRAGHGRAAV